MLLRSFWTKIVFFFRCVSRSSDRAPMSKHGSKNSDLSSRSGPPSQNSEFRMSVLLGKSENSSSQKDLHSSRSPAVRNKTSTHPRDKASLRSKDTFRLVSDNKQSISLYEVRQLINFIRSGQINCMKFKKNYRLYSEQPFFVIIFIKYCFCYKFKNQNIPS